MAFVVVLFRGEEVTRRELSADHPLVIGRSPECDISVRDIILSRRHCRLVPAEKGWAVEDLGSKNGTHIGPETVQYAALTDGTAVRIGKTQVKFYAGSMQAAPAPRKAASDRRKRPADPFEALSGTVAAFEFDSGLPKRDLSKLPTPLPKPADPASYSDEDVYTMITEIASSSWDSIYATASEPAAVMVAGQTKRRPLPVPGAKVVGSADMPPRRRKVVTDPSLQVVPDAGEAPALSTIDLAIQSDPSNAQPNGHDWFKPVRSVWRGMKHVLTGRFLRRAG
jgi:pSer/pThr/pTyr-binding forkhead associated (FHA) protein